MLTATCRHCAKGKVCRPRGLCWRCWFTPGVREMYPITSKFARKGEGLRGEDLALPVPTAARPGTAEKLAVLAQRVMRREALFHPADGPDLS